MDIFGDYSQIFFPYLMTQIISRHFFSLKKKKIVLKLALKFLQD